VQRKLICLDQQGSNPHQQGSKGAEKTQEHAITAEPVPPEWIPHPRDLQAAMPQRDHLCSNALRTSTLTPTIGTEEVNHGY
jgi:hypothetical protein